MRRPAKITLAFRESTSYVKGSAAKRSDIRSIVGRARGEFEGMLRVEGGRH